MTAKQWSILGGLIGAAITGIATGVANGTINIGPEWTPIIGAFCSLLVLVVSVLTPKVTG